jgi:hypothetical protein
MFFELRVSEVEQKLAANHMHRFQIVFGAADWTWTGHSFVIKLYQGTAVLQHLR